MNTAHDEHVSYHVLLFVANIKYTHNVSVL